MRFWFLTLKWNEDPNPEWEDYDWALKKLLIRFKHIKATNEAYEIDSKGKLHYHCILEGKFIRFKEWIDDLQRMGFHINVQEIQTTDDLKRICQYLTKQRLNRYECEQACVIRDTLLEYPFIDPV